MSLKCLCVSTDSKDEQKLEWGEKSIFNLIFVLETSNDFMVYN